MESRAGGGGEEKSIRAVGREHGREQEKTHRREEGGGWENGTAILFLAVASEERDSVTLGRPS
jgi:hypothetical protein